MALVRDGMVWADAVEIQQIFDNAKKRMAAAKAIREFDKYKNSFGNHLGGSFGEFACDEFATKHGLTVIPEYSQSLFGRIDMRFTLNGVQQDVSVKTTSRTSKKTLYPQRQMARLDRSAIVIWCYSFHTLDVFNDEEPPSHLPRQCAVQLQGWSHGREVHDGAVEIETYNGVEEKFWTPTAVHSMDEFLALFRK